MSNNTPEDELVEVDPKTFSPNPFQVRVIRDMDPRVMARVESIRKNGLIEPPIIRRVDGGYQVAAGHIRIRAFIILGIKKVRCILRQLTDEAMATIVVEENLKHETLNPIEEGKGYRNMKDVFHWTEEQIATKFGTTRDIVAQRLRLLTFQDQLQQLIAEGRLSVSHGEAVNMAPASKQMVLAKRVLEEGLTVKQTTDEAKRLLEVEKANTLVMENIGGIVTGITSRFAELETKMSAAERLLLWVDLDGHHGWKQQSCKYNTEGWCQRFVAAHEPLHLEQRLTGVANFKQLEDGTWHIQACTAVCAHCTVYEPKPEFSLGSQ